MDFAELKKGGFMKQVQKDFFAARLRVAGGNLTLEQLDAILAVAREYGNGYIHLTTRQGVEIPFVAQRDIESVRQKLAEAGLGPGVCGGTVRGVVACQGSALCRYGLIDAKKLSEEIDRGFFGEPVPGKFKIALTGCPRSCAKPQENDLGFEGAVVPVLRADACISCGICAESCPAGAIVRGDGPPQLDVGKCIKCGDCLSSCPTAAWQAASVGVRVWAGGRIGRDPKLGQVVTDFLPLEKIPAAISAALDFFRTHGRAKERFGKVVERVGEDSLKEVLKHAAGKDD